MHDHPVYFYAYEVIGWGICLVMFGVILRRQLSPGASLAWLGIIFLHPYIGLALYLMVGESRLGPRRASAHLRIISRVRDPSRLTARRGYSDEPLSPEYMPMTLQAEKISGLPVLAGNAVEFFPDHLAFLDGLVADIGKAKSEVNLLYYMFVGDATGQRVTGALAAAQHRGVKCRVLVDALASRLFFHQGGPGPELVRHGVQIAAALPVAPVRRRLARLDLRNHRKLAVIDGKIAWAGSHNLVNPDYGGRRGNPWLDVTARLRGPIVGELAMVFAEDWAFETGEEIAAVSPESLQEMGTISAQAVPTGPSLPHATYRQLLLAAIQCSRRQLTLTTPYFVPDEPTMLALTMAADRGVDVKLLLPKNPDHFFTAAAGRAHFQVLLESGVTIHLYRPGLLHTKSATVDDAFTLFGSANLDLRSFKLNFELSLLMYGSEVTAAMRRIHTAYLADCDALTAAIWSQRRAIDRYADAAVSLLSPLL